MLERLEQHPGLKAIYSSRWVEEQFRLGPTQGFHPVVQVLLGSTFGEALVAGMEKAWLTVSGQKDPGALGSRRLWLAGSVRRSWQENHRDWWTAVAEVYLAAYLVKRGYRVRFQGKGSDLALYDEGSEPVGYMEVHAPRQTLENSEFGHELFWALQGRGPLDISFNAEPSWDSLDLARANARRAAADVARLHDLAGSGIPLPLKRRLVMANGYLEVEIGPETNGMTHYHRRAWYGGASVAEALVEDIVDRAKAKRKRRQLTTDAGWTVFAVEIAAYYPIPMYTSVFSTASMDAFPVNRLPGYVAALVLYAVDLPRGEPGPTRAFPNPNSPWTRDASLTRLIELLDRPLRRPHKRP